MVNNAKGKLLELGGTLTSERAGGSDHEPVFLAVAELGGQRMSTKAAGSKLSVEQRAARLLLNSVFAVDY